MDCFSYTLILLFVTCDQLVRYCQAYFRLFSVYLFAFAIAFVCSGVKKPWFGFSLDTHTHTNIIYTKQLGMQSETPQMLFDWVVNNMQITNWYWIIGVGNEKTKEKIAAMIFSHCVVNNQQSLMTFHWLVFYTVYSIITTMLNRLTRKSDSFRRAQCVIISRVDWLLWYVHVSSCCNGYHSVNRNKSTFRLIIPPLRVMRIQSGH